MLAVPLVATSQTFNGDGVTRAFVLSHVPRAGALLLVFVDSVLQRVSTDYTMGGATLTFGAAPFTGTNNIDVRYST